MRNTAWAALSQICRLSAQLIAALVLARYLAPNDFGLIAMAGVAINLGNLLRDFGLGAAVIQAKNLNQGKKDSIYGWSLVAGVGLGGMMLLLAPALGHAMQSNELVPVLSASAVLFPIAALGSFHQACLERAFQFKKLAVVEVAGAILSVLFAILCAHLGFGVFSLIAQSLVYGAIVAFGVRLTSRETVRPRVRLVDARRFLSFAGNLTGFNISNYLIRNADAYLIGRYLGPASLGFYSMAMKMTLLPVQAITQVFGRTLLPSLSATQHDKAAVFREYVRNVKATAGVTVVLMGLAWSWREQLVQLLFGPAWAPVAELVAYLAPTVFLQSLAVATGTVHIAMGQTATLFRLSLVSATLFVLVFILGSQFGTKELLSLYLLAVCFNVAIWTFATCRLLDGKVQHLLMPLLPIVVAGVALAGLARQLPYSWRDSTGLLPVVAMGLGVGLICATICFYSFVWLRRPFQTTT